MLCCSQPPRDPRPLGTLNRTPAGPTATAGRPWEPGGRVGSQLQAPGPLHPTCLPGGLQGPRGRPPQATWGPLPGLASRPPEGLTSHLSGIALWGKELGKALNSHQGTGRNSWARPLCLKSFLIFGRTTWHVGLKIQLTPLHWKGGVSTAGPRGKSWRSSYETQLSRGGDRGRSPVTELLRTGPVSGPSRQLGPACSGGRLLCPRGLA